MTKMGFCVTAFVAAVAWLGPPAASADPSGSGCPRGYQPQPVEYVLSQATPGFEDAIRAMDANRDGVLCYKLLASVPLYDPTFLYIDNDNPGQLK